MRRTSAKAAPRKPARAVKAKALRPMAPTESERNAALRAQLAAAEERAARLQSEVERVTNVAFANAQVAQRLRLQLAAMLPQMRRLLAEKDSLLRNQGRLMARPQVPAEVVWPQSGAEPHA